MTSTIAEAILKDSVCCFLLCDRGLARFCELRSMDHWGGKTHENQERLRALRFRQDIVEGRHRCQGGKEVGDDAAKKGCGPKEDLRAHTGHGRSRCGQVRGFSEQEAQGCPARHVPEGHRP